MSDTTFSTATNATGVKDFNQIKSTINDFENYKITSDQANQAFQQEWNQVKNDGVDTMVINSFKNSESPDKPIHGFPNLTFQTPDENDYNSTFKQQKALNGDNRSVKVDYKNGSVTADSTQNDQAVADKINQTRSKFLDPINASADQYFAGDIDSKTANAQISNEIKTAEAGGFNFKSADFSAIAATSDNQIHFTNLNNGKIGISQSSDAGYAKRIEFDPSSTQVTSESLNPGAKLYATDIGTSVAELSTIGGLWGACNFVAGAVPGAIIGAAAGVVKGAVEGHFDSSNVKKSLIADPTLIFKQ